MRQGSKAVRDSNKSSPHDALLQSSRPRSSSTDGTCGPNLASMLLLPSEEVDRPERPEGSSLSPGPTIPPCDANGLLCPKRSRRVVAQLRQKILKLTEQIKVEQAARDSNVAEYLELAHGAAGRQQAARIKQAFEKKNQRSALGLQQLHSKLERYHRRLCRAERSAAPRQPGDGQQSLRDVGARVTAALCGATQSMVARCKESTPLLRDKFDSVDSISASRDAPDENRGDEGAAASSRPGLSYNSEDDCSSATSGSEGGADSTTGGLGVLHGSKANTQMDELGPAFETLLHEVREVRDAQVRLVDSLEKLKTHYRRDYTFILQALQEERYRCEHLEEQLSDLSELHQNEIFILKQELASMEEKVAYQSYEQGRDVQEALEACQTRIFKMEQQQQASQQEDPYRAAAQTPLGKLVSMIHAVLTTMVNCVPAFLRTFPHSCFLFLLLALLWRSWHYTSED